MSQFATLPVFGSPLTLAHYPARRARWRFAGTTLVRARRLAGLEQTFEADPQLAALTVDLMEEVTELRRRLHQLI